MEREISFSADIDVRGQLGCVEFFITDPRIQNGDRTANNGEIPLALSAALRPPNPQPASFIAPAPGYASSSELRDPLPSEFPLASAGDDGVELIAQHSRNPSPEPSICASCMPSLHGSFDSTNITFDAEDDKNTRKLEIIRDIDRWKQKIDVTEEVAAEVLLEFDAARDHLREVDKRYERLLQIVSRSSMRILHLEREYGMLMASDGEGPWAGVE
jgi:hypothetical protein